MKVQSGSNIEAGREALTRGDWKRAQALFEQAAATDPLPEAFEGLAEACWWQHDEQGTFAAREQAYQLFQKRGDRAPAARMATWLATDSIEFRGEPAVANGWLQRAYRLLEGLEDTPEYGWLTLWDAYLVLNLQNDTAATRRLAAKAVASGRSHGLLDLEMLALATEGMALVSEGEIREGMKRLDEAATAAVTGEMTDRAAVWTTLCTMMTACDRIRDYDRAVQWCTRVKDVSSRQGFDALFTSCRPPYASVLMWRGDWDEAEQQLVAACREIAALRPMMAGESIVRLAELRWRQGRWDEAAELFRQVEHEGIAQPGRAELAISTGDARAARGFAERYLRNLPTEDRMERAIGLELMVRSAAAMGECQAAEEPLAELQRIAKHVGVKPIKASAAFAAGSVAAARGDYENARTCLEDAVDFYERSGAPFEAARARMRLARSLVELKRQVDAGREAALALQSFRRIGAAKEAEGAAAFLADLQAPDAAAAGISNPAALSSREIEVLALVAAGKSNLEIAEDLFLSVRTVERHISTIYEKLGAHGKAARAMATAYALKHGLVSTN
jgi:LuxR family transcriptional regulator, maltose regulon positive regulatory protein